MAKTGSVPDGSVVSATDTDSDVQTSVVLPAYNESENLKPLIDEIQSTFRNNTTYGPYEIVIVDDGSTDGTAETIRQIATGSDKVMGVLLRRNFGQSAALAAGIDYATGAYIVTMDADRQNNPADIPKLLTKLEEGYDCVSGWRRDRDDPLSKTIPSAIQTRLAKLTGPDIHDFGCTLTAYRAGGLKEIDLYGEGHRYIPAKLHKRGYKITELPVDHRPRTAGKTKYGMKRLVKGFVDLLFHVFWNRFSTRPSHFFGGIGLVLMTVGGLIGSHMVFLKYAFGQSLEPHVPRLILTVALVIFGVQLVMFGFLAEMIVKQQYRDEQPYRVNAIIGKD
ncbi:glycosyltransferase group 2 family protein [Haloarcula rubripromontorii]|uniref:Glycosyltransferase group 2 family protein n=1 Tax=Haloarcula rubripromontorii TaxID=1705562 RepID=A0A0M9AJJ1_9EURY|nr:glycosyltransferase family 2 protein [Haloarcula rubripromontorii]KOX92125.1 glycosyltransferase group 2 family protein [Haloarcula rubripromontorii]